MIVSNDLLFRSRVEAVRSGFHGEVVVQGNVNVLVPGSVVVLDCNRQVEHQLTFLAGMPAAIRSTVTVVAVCSHVDTATRATMKATGVSVICTNGSMQRVVARILGKELNDASHT